MSLPARSFAGIPLVGCVPAEPLCSAVPSLLGVRCRGSCLALVVSSCADLALLLFLLSSLPSFLFPLPACCSWQAMCCPPPPQACRVTPRCPEAVPSSGRSCAHHGRWSSAGRGRVVRWEPAAQRAVSAAHGVVVLHVMTYSSGCQQAGLGTAAGLERCPLSLRARAGSGCASLRSTSGQLWEVGACLLLHPHLFILCFTGAGANTRVPTLRT